MPAKESGIYLAVRANIDPLTTDLNVAKAQAASLGKDISDALGKAVNVDKATKNVRALTDSLGTLARMPKEITFAPVIDGLDTVAAKMGVSKQRIEEMYGAMAKTTAAKAHEDALKNLQKQAGLTSSEMVKLRKDVGDVSGALKTAMGALNTRSNVAIVADMKEAVAAFREVRQNADSTASDVQRASKAMRESLKKLATEAKGVKIEPPKVEIPKIELTSLQKAMQQVQASTKLSTQEIDRLNASASRFAAKKDLDGAFACIQKQAGLSAVEMAKLRYQLGDTSGALKAMGAAALPVVGAVAAVSAGVAIAGKACLDATLQADRLNKAYVSIAGSSSGAVVQLDQIRTTADRLGLQFQSTAESAKTFFAAGKDTTLEPEMNRIFEAVSTAGSALSLSTDQMQGSFLALGQMISKGKVQAEELRGQLGERLPGAFKFAAQAMNMTTAELDKFMADGKLTADVLLPRLATVLQNEFGAAAIKASQGVQGAVNRLSSEWETFKASIMDSSAAAAGINGVRSAVVGLSTAFAALSEYSSALKGLAVGVGVAAGLSGIAVAIKACLPVLSALTTAFGVNSALIFAGGLNVASKALAGLTAAIMANPVGAFAVAIGTLAAGAVYLGDKLNEEKAILRTLNDAQKTAEEGAKALADAHKLSADELDNLIAKQREAATALQSVEASVRDRLSTQGYYGFDKLDMGDERVRASLEMLGESLPTEELGKFEQALEDAKHAALQTSDWRKLQTELDTIERNAKASGQYTDELRVAIENARAAARDGIVFNVTIRENHEITKTVNDALASRYENLEDKRARERILLQQREEADMAKTLSEYQKNTDTGRLEVLRSQSKELERQISALSNSLLPAEKRNEQAKMLNALLENTNGKISNILKKGDKKDTALEQARRNAESYKAELDKTTASVSALQAQLAAPAGDVVTRDQIKIAKEYEQAVADITKEAANYASKKGISKAQAKELEAQKLLEAELKKTLALRDAETKNAEVRLDFEKRYADMVGATSEGVIASIKKQVAEYASAGADRVRLAEWERDQIQRASTDAWDGAAVALRDYSAEAGNQAKGMNEAFGDLFNGLDSGFGNVWNQMLEDGKVSLSSFRSMFASFLADLMHMAVTRPITVSIAGVVGGMLPVATGTAQAATGSGGGNLTSFMPSNLFSGIKGTINSSMMEWFPGTFGTGYALNFASSGGALTTGTMSSAAINSVTGAGYGGMSMSSAGALPTFSGAVSPYLGAAGLGSMGYSLLGGAIGLPQSKYSGLTAGLGSAAGYGLGSLAAGSAMAAGSSMAAGAAFGSVIPVIGTVLGALGGGLLGSLFGQKRKTKPSVYTLSNNMPISSEFDYTNAFMQGAWYDRAGTKEAEAVMPILGDAAKVAAQQVEALVAALPEEFRGQVEAQIAASTFSAGRGVPGMDKHNWNFQFYDEDQLKERLEAVVKDIQVAIGKTAQQAMADVDLTSMYNFDLSTSEGMDRAVKAVTSVKEITEATKAISEPASQLVEQAKAAKAQMDAWKVSMQEVGVVTEYATSLVDTYRQASIKANIDALQESLNPLSQYETALKAANNAVDDTVAALKVLGGTEEEIARIEGMRAQVIESMVGPMRTAFEQDMRVREAQLSGDDRRGAVVQQLVQHERELDDVRAKFGAQSLEYSRVLRVQEAERQMLSVQYERQRIESLQTAITQAEQAYSSALSGAQSSGDAWVNAAESAFRSAQSAYENEAKSVLSANKQLAESFRSLRESLYLDSRLNPQGQTGAYDAAKMQVEKLYSRAMGGDVDAAQQLNSAAKSFLDQSFASKGEYGDYAKDFYDMSAKLAAVEATAKKQADDAQRQLDALTGIDDTGKKTLEQLKSDMDAARRQYDLATRVVNNYYDQWGLDRVNPGIQGLKDQFYQSVDQLELAERELNTALQAAVVNSGATAAYGLEALRTQAESGLTSQLAALSRVESAVRNISISVSYPEYPQSLKAFASGGLAARGWAIVGEEGPEVVNFSNPGRVYTAEETSAMLAPRVLTMPAQGSDGAVRAENRLLREEVRGLRRDMQLLIAETRKIRNYSQRSTSAQEEMASYGVLVKEGGLQ